MNWFGISIKTSRASIAPSFFSSVNETNCTISRWAHCPDTGCRNSCHPHIHQNAEYERDNEASPDSTSRFASRQYKEALNGKMPQKKLLDVTPLSESSSLIRVKSALPTPTTIIDMGSPVYNITYRTQIIEILTHNIVSLLSNLMLLWWQTLTSPSPVQSKYNASPSVTTDENDENAKRWYFSPDILWFIFLVQCRLPVSPRRWWWEVLCILPQDAAQL